MGWTFYNAGEEFERRREDWNELNRAYFDHVLLDASFVAPMVKHFGDRKTVLGVYDGAEDRSMLLLERRGWGFWQTFQPSQAPLGLVLFPPADFGLEITRGLLRCLSPMSLGLGLTQQDPDFTSFVRRGSEEGPEFLDYIDTPRLDIVGSFEDYWASRSRNLKHNLKRQRKRFAEQGVEVRLVTNRDSSSVASRISEYGELEQHGWKSSLGTAIAIDNPQGAFYRDVLEAACVRNEGVVYSLLIGGRAAASDLCLQRDGTLVILKTAYDSSIKGCSPGLLLHEEILKTLFAQGQIRRVEFYGRMLEWHSKLTDQVRRMYHVNVYRNTWVRGLCQTTKRILPRSAGAGSLDGAGWGSPGSGQDKGAPPSQS